MVEGSISIVDENGNDERFEAGDCFFLQRGFNGYWNQLQALKTFHMTVAPLSAANTEVYNHAI
ncbi:MAG: DUF861 domain-containing protein [Gammaproteobacteria bacterium]|nr:DUF861 domain-containing protein [Gammaproteobacteria bacterium]